MSDIANKLINWFIQNQRILPWRDKPEPYRVWISEIMLQQTRVQAVIPYYNKFLSSFPDVKALADANLEEVLHAWLGLGYYARARHLHQTAKVILDQYSGIFPQDYKTILALPGIGKYTAAAILSIAFNQHYPVMDGNVLRVMARLNNITSDIRQSNTEKVIAKHLIKIFPENQASDFNQGMMELGALICIPKQPKCKECPLSENCLAFKNDRQSELPCRSQNPKPIIVKRILFLIRQEDKVFIHLRKSNGLLASMWEFPSVNSSVKKAESQFQMDYGIIVHIGKKLFEAEHVFTHRLWKMKIYEGFIKSENNFAENQFKWVSVNDLKNYPIPNAFKSIVKYCTTCFLT